MRGGGLVRGPDCTGCLLCALVHRSTSAKSMKWPWGWLVGHSGLLDVASRCFKSMSGAAMPCFDDTHEDTLQHIGCKLNVGFIAISKEVRLSREQGATHGACVHSAGTART